MRVRSIRGPLELATAARVRPQRPAHGPDESTYHGVILFVRFRFRCGHRADRARYRGSRSRVVCQYGARNALFRALVHEIQVTGRRKIKPFFRVPINNGTPGIKPGVRIVTD